MRRALRGLAGIGALAAVAAPPAHSQNAFSRPKLLIVSAADVGMSASVNRAAFAAVDRGTVSSVSVMVVGDAFDDAVALVRKHPGLDVGLHLVVSAEWPKARWRPILPGAVVSSLCDADGSFRHRFEAVPTDVRELEQELRAQVMVARAAGLPLTHLDVHKNALYGSGSLYGEMLARIARDERLPVALSRAGATEWGALASQLSDAPLLDAWTTITPVETAARWPRWYELAVRGAPSGVSELVVHPGYDDPELQGLTEGAEAWGAAWRQRDLDVLMGDVFQRELTERNVRLVGWHDLPRRGRPADTPPK